MCFNDHVSLNFCFCHHQSLGLYQHVTWVTVFLKVQIPNYLLILITYERYSKEKKAKYLNWTFAILELLLQLKLKYQKYPCYF